MLTSAAAMPYLWLASVMVGLDEDLSQADVFAHSHQSLLHRLSCSQDGNTCDLQTHTGGTQHCRHAHRNIQINCCCRHWKVIKDDLHRDLFTSLVLYKYLATIVTKIY